MTVLTALAAYYDRLAAKGEASDPGYAPAKIGFEVVLTPDGRAEINDLRSLEKGRPRPRPIEVPAVARAYGIRPAFLWDKTAYVLGVVNAKGDDGQVRIEQGRRTAEEHAAFKRYHEDALAGTEDEGLRALLVFLRNWTPSSYESGGWNPELLDANLVFRLKGDVSTAGSRRYLHERPEARRIWARLSAPKGREGICLVTGTRGPVASTHAKIKGVSGKQAQSAGTAIVSFNAPAYESFGKEQGANAPVSEAAAFAYTTALNALLANASRRILLGDATAVFWADSAGGSEKSAAAAEDVFAAWVDPHDEDADVSDFARMRAAMESIADGRGWPDAPDLDARTRFHFLGLSPNQARLAIRFWHVGSFGEFARTLADHYRDFEIEPAAFARPPKLGAWLFETAVQRKAENIPPLLGGEFMRAVLSGSRYPRILLTTVIGRVRADGIVNGARAAICKAFIQRELRLRGSKEVVPMSLDQDNTHPAYRLGRLFALYEWAEDAAETRSATIRDKFFAGASATPARVFPIIMRGSTHNLAKLRKAGKGGIAVLIDREIAAVMDGLQDPLPRTFRLEDQGRFVVGYYHQERARYAGSKPESAAAQEE
jgi:CRISPR-associated protein Csd1